MVRLLLVYLALELLGIALIPVWIIAGLMALLFWAFCWPFQFLVDEEDTIAS